MTKIIVKATNLKYHDIWEKDDFCYQIIYSDLKKDDFCCDEIYNVLLGENDGNCELCFGYEPVFREYFIDIRFEYGGAVKLIKHCPWCGSKFLGSLRDKWFDTLEKEYKIETDIGEYKERSDIPQEFKSDEWWKKRNL